MIILRRRNKTLIDTSGNMICGVNFHKNNYETSEQTMARMREKYRNCNRPKAYYSWK